MSTDLIAALRGEDGDLFAKEAAAVIEQLSAAYVRSGEREHQLRGEIHRQSKLLDKDAAVAGHMQTIVDGLRLQLEALRAAAVNAIERAAVFDDGTDGADAESARSVVAILRGALAPQPADATDAARAGRQQDEREAVELQRILFAHYREVRPLDAGLFGWAAVALARQGVPQTPVDDLLLELEGMRSSLETARHNWRGFEDRCGDLQVENGKLRDELQALKAPCSEVPEPVAWARQADLDDPSDCLFVSRYQYLATDYSVALYTAAPPAAQDVSGLVEALEAISGLHASSNAVARNIARSALLSAATARPAVQEQGEVQGRWIPVSERLPSVAQEVIVNSEFDGVTAGFLDSYGEWYSPNSDYKLTRVVAWQPLPAAPALSASTGQEVKS